MQITRNSFAKSRWDLHLRKREKASIFVLLSTSIFVLSSNYTWVIVHKVMLWLLFLCRIIAFSLIFFLFYGCALRDNLSFTRALFWVHKYIIIKNLRRNHSWLFTYINWVLLKIIPQNSHCRNYFSKNMYKFSWYTCKIKIINCICNRIIVINKEKVSAYVWCN